MIDDLRRERIGPACTATRQCVGRDGKSEIHERQRGQDEMRPQSHRAPRLERGSRRVVVVVVVVGVVCVCVKSV